MYSNELYHHGILGQKWGVQNGPPYPLGSGDHSASEQKAGWRKSLNSLKPSILKKKGKNEKDEEKEKRKEAVNSRKKAIKNLKSLSDEDVKKLVERLQNEKKIKELNEEDLAPGRAAVQRILKDVGSDVGKTAVSAALKYYIRKAAGEEVTGKDFAAYFRPKK